MNVQRKQNMQKILLADDSATLKLAGLFAKYVKPGLVIALCGDLGTGKTTFTRGLASQMGVAEELVNSPTYLLQQDYLTPFGLIIHHFDAYRLEDPEHFEMLGVGETFDSEGVSIVEWADRVPDSIPSSAWWLFLSHNPDGMGRMAQFRVPDDVFKKIMLEM